MKIAVYKYDKNSKPYLVHSKIKGLSYSLGLANYPEIEQDYYVSKNRLKILKKGTKRYKLAQKIIKKLLK